MFPIRDHNPSERTPFVTYALIAINTVVFLAYYPASTDQSLFRFYSEWALLPENVADGRNLGTLVTSMFLHGGWMHIIGNMLFLWIFGDNLEDIMGHIGFLLFYLAGGVAAGFFHVIADPSSAIPTVGASGAIAGVMGGYLLLFPRARVDILIIIIIFVRIFPLPAWVMLGLWFVLQLINGVITDATGGGVAYWAHAGGFVAGFVLTLSVWLRLGGQAFWQRTEGHPDHPEAKYNFAQSSIPKVTRRR